MGSSCHWKGGFDQNLHSEVGWGMAPNHNLYHHKRATYNAGRTLLLRMSKLPTGEHHTGFGMYDHML